MNSIKISVCYIVKNEEDTLARSLSSVHQLADELIVVDTGSSDNTKNIASSYGAKIYDYMWQEDFAAARNFALEKLNGDWVLFLDADEYFTFNIVKNLRNVIAEQDSTVNLILVQRQDVDDNGKLMLSVYVPRIFRVRDDLRYEGAIHEELRQNGEPVTGVVAVDPERLQLIHTGYAGELGKNKAYRNLKILQKELARTSNPGHLYGYLAEAYDGIDDRENAMKYAYMDVERGRQAETYASRSYRLLLTKLSEQKSEYQERQRVAKQAVQDYPELPDFHAEYAESLAAGWRYAEAAREMAEAIRIGNDYHGLEPSVVDDSMVMLWQERCIFFQKLDKLSKQIKISACVITKNEERNIGAWLDNAQIYADECIVLDTGSNDRTCALAEQGGSKLYHYDWQDDFAAAKNMAISYAKGSWLTFLDADEIVDRPELVRGMIAEYELMNPKIDVIVMTSINVDMDDGYREISRYPNMRIFRNKQGLRYRGCVHENLLYENGSMPESLYEERLFFRHTGYSTSVITGKIERNLALLQKEIAKTGEQPGHFRYLADCYYALGDYRQAEYYALQAIESPVKGMGTHGDMYYMVLKCMAALQDSAEEQLAFARTASQRFPELPDFPAVMGRIYQEAGQYEQGEKYLNKAFSLAQNNNGRESSAFGDIESLAYANLADCELHLGKEDKAREHSCRAMEINPYEEQALVIFCELRQGSGAHLALELKRYFTESEQDISFLWRFGERNGFGEVYDYYRDRLKDLHGKEVPRQHYYELLQKGTWQQLVEDLQIGLIGNMELSVDLLLRLERKVGKKYRQMEKQLIDLLPAEVQGCWDRTLRGEVPDDWGGYKVIWPYILSYGDENQIGHFAELSLGQSEIWPNLVTDMMEQEKWQSAFNLLAKVHKDEADGKFWQDLGRCLFHLGDYEAAKEAFERAKQEGFNTLVLKSYEHWLGNI